MKYLIFDWMKCGENENIGDLSEISDKEFEEFAKKYGYIFNDSNEFQAHFNSERISTDIHQLRIVEEE